MPTVISNRMNIQDVGVNKLILKTIRNITNPAIKYLDKSENSVCKLSCLWIIKIWYTVTDISEITVAIDAPTVPRYIISGIFNIKLTIAPMISDTVYDLFWLVGKRYWLPIALLQAIKIIAIDSIINTGITSLNWDVKKWH